MPEFVRFHRPYVIFISLTLLLLFLNACTTSEAPTNELSPLGSHLETAVASLQADPTFLALGVQLDPEYATGSLALDGYGLIAQQPEEATFYIATLRGSASGAVRTLHELAIDEQGEATFSDLETGRSTALGNVSSYVDSEGNPLPGQEAALQKVFFKFFNGTSAGGQLGSQSFSVQDTSRFIIPSCDACRLHADYLEDANKRMSTSATITTVGLFAGAVGKVGGKAGNIVKAALNRLGFSVSGLGALDLHDSTVNQLEKEQIYYDCIAGSLSYVPYSCPPQIEVSAGEVTPAGPYEVGDLAHIYITITNVGSEDTNSNSRLSYTVKRSDKAIATMSRVDSGGTLDPGQSASIYTQLVCAELGTNPGTITITHNADNKASPITIPVELTCKPNIEVELRGDPGNYSGSFSSVTIDSGDDVRLIPSIAGDPYRAGLILEVAEGAGTITRRAGRYYYIAPLENPVGGRTINVVATSKTDPTKSDTLPVTIRGITVDLYGEAGHYTDKPSKQVTFASGTGVRMIPRVKHDASRKGVSYEVTSGIGSVVKRTSYTYYYNASLCHYGDQAPVTASATVEATSKADPSRKDSISITVVSKYCGD